MKLLITGATGYVGQRLVNLAITHNFAIICASRTPPQTSFHLLDALALAKQKNCLITKVSWMPFDLLSDRDVVLPDDVTHVIHLAAITNNEESNPALEIRAAQRLIQASQKIDARFIFISSQVARSNAPTDYGRVKAAIESLTSAADGWVLRPGLVYGGCELGLFGTLTTAIRRVPAYPRFFPAPRIQPVHVDDLCMAIVACANRPARTGRILCIGATTTISFNRFLQLIGMHWVRKIRIGIPIPSISIYFLSRVLGVRLSDRLGIQRLLSLFVLPTMETEDNLAELGITLRPLSAGLSRIKLVNRRALTAEGYALLRYILRSRPDLALVKRYVRAIEQLNGAEPIGLPNLCIQWPSTIALLERAANNERLLRQKFDWRLNAGVAIVEASKRGATLMIGPSGGENIAICIFRISLAVMNEISWRTVGLFIKPSLQLSRSTDKADHDDR